MITIQSGKMMIPEEERFVGFAGDDQSNTKQFILPQTQITDVDAVFSLYLRFDDDRVTSAPLSISIVDGDTILTWTIRAEHLLRSGIVMAQIRHAAGNGVVTHYSWDYFVVGASAELADDGSEIDVLSRSEFEERMAQAVRDARATAPYIGSDGYWYIYSREQGDYVRSFMANGTMVDSSVSESSANPVENRAVKAYVDAVAEYSLSPVLTLISEKYVKYTNGQEAPTNAAFKCTDYFEISAGMKIKLVNFTAHAANASGICFYDEEHTFISGRQYAAEVQTEEVFTAPEGTKYCRFTISSVKESVFKCYLGGFAEAINGTAYSDTAKLRRFEDIADYRMGHYIKWADGVQAGTPTLTFLSTDYIPVYGMTKLRLTNVKSASYGGGEAGIAFYNNCMGFISGIEYPNDGSKSFSCTLPEGACYTRFTFRSGNAYAGRGIMMTDEQYRKALTFRNRVKTPLTGKLVCANGDSITVGYNVQNSENYDTDLATALGKTLSYPVLTGYKNQCDVVNRGVSHEPFARIVVHGVERYGFLTPSSDPDKPTRYTGIPAKVDYVTLMFGWNDYYWGRISEKEKWLKNTYGTDIWFPEEDAGLIGTDGYTTQEQYDAVMAYTGTIDGVSYTGNQYYQRKFLGHIEDTTPWTWYGAWNFYFNTVKITRPEAVIGVVMCYGTNADYRNALREVCQKHGIPLLDIYSDKLPLFFGKESTSSSITSDQISANKSFVLLSDNIHPSYDGHKRLADMYSGWLNTL